MEVGPRAPFGVSDRRRPPRVVRGVADAGGVRGSSRWRGPLADWCLVEGPGLGAVVAGVVPLNTEALTALARYRLHQLA